MTDAERPTNQQLANFLVVDAKNDPRTARLNPHPDILVRLLETNPLFKAAAIKKHASFQEMINQNYDLLKEGRLQCSHIRSNGRNCPNFNEPGNFYCGLHKD